MTAAAVSLLESALGLQEQDRILIAEALLESLPDDSVELEDDALCQELMRRVEETRTDPGASIPWSEVKKMR